MAAINSILLALLGFLLSHSLGHADGKSNVFDPPVYIRDQMETSISRPLFILTADVDESGSTENRGTELRNQGDKPPPQLEKKSKSKKKQPNRNVLPRVTPPSEAIKADQAVDFPYDI